jgi:hypothetical protein
MDKVLFGDEPLVVFLTIYCILVVHFEFHFLQRYCTKVVPLCAIVATLLQCAIGCGQHSNKFVTGDQWVFVTLWQICYRASKVIGNPLTNSPKGIGNFCK